MPASASPGRVTVVAVLAATLFVFAGVVAYVSLWLRSGLRDQILRREAEALTEVASLQLSNEAETLAKLGIAEAPDQLLNAVLRTSKLRGVFAVRVFDRNRHFLGALPIPWSEAVPADELWRELAAGGPRAMLHRRESAAEVIGLAPEGGLGAESDLLEAWLPLRYGEAAQFGGVAQLWIDGATVAREFAAVDARLWRHALLAWSAGALIIGVLLDLAFRRLAKANRELMARTDDLARANRELTLAAKSSALGAVAAHLMHELKNPVAGLEQLVATQAGGQAREDGDSSLAAASELTRRLRTMINDVVAVMRDEQHGSHFELTVAEIVELAAAKVSKLADERGVTLDAQATGEAVLQGREANLALLVLKNLLQNALEAGGAGTTIRLLGSASDGIRFSIIDSGPGLPPHVVGNLFQPCASTKRGGSGLGLALSQQLARQAGAVIELVQTGPKGTRFDLVFPKIR